MVEPEVGPPRYAPLETVCNGKDDDQDGHVDLLIATGANACATGKQGICSKGWRKCEDGVAVCEAPSPMPEVDDELDNDCNGIIDDTPAARARPRALVLAPRYVIKDARADVDLVTGLLAQAGVAFDAQKPTEDWSKLIDAFGRYSLLVIPGYLEGSALSDAMRDALIDFATGGGVVVVMRPFATQGHNNPNVLAGLKSSSRVNQGATIRILQNAAPALAALDTAEERTLPLTSDPIKAPVETWVFEPENDTVELATTYNGKTALGSSITRRSVGKGAIYALGHDFASYDVSRCYINCFEPAGDVLRLILRDALREGAGGHVVLKHTMPGAAPGALILTHNASARDAFYGADPSDRAGDSGLMQMSEMEKRNEVSATTFAPSEYAGSEVLRKLCAERTCSIGAQGVSAGAIARGLPYGTCKEVGSTYGDAAPTVCGEIRVSIEGMTAASHQRVRAWRSPRLRNPPSLFDILAPHGVLFDSSLAVGDLKYNLPVDTHTFPRVQHLFHKRKLYEFPISGEDGRDDAELTLSNRAWFANAWEHTLLENARNGSITTLAVRPSRSSDTEQNLPTKIALMEHMIQLAKAHGILVDSLTSYGEFWRARAGVLFDVEYDAASGYRGAFAVGSEAVTNLTFEFGDALESFECAACGPTAVKGRFVTLRSRLKPGLRATFVATPKRK